ncbi:MAG: D-alanyl-D-alanine carboxypeptidase [Rhodospirillales bacterium]|nr:D-alanyl-D-alanine carboxypeptidase [Rhodospirillales bacterium]
MRGFILYFLTGIVFFSLSLSFPALAQEPETAAKQAYIVDFDTGAVLYEKNAHEPMPTSSMSKVMTILAVFQALEDGRIKLDDELPVSEKAWRMGGSKMFVEVGKKVKVEDLIRGVIVQSGNDATVVLAEALSGTETAFAQSLNELAKKIGMTESHFVNASGWPDENHYSTAHDLTLMGVYLIKTYPQYYKYYSEMEFVFNNIPQGNRNPLLYRDIGADGIKTGHTEIAGYGLIGSGKRDGRRVVMVLNGMSSMQERADESARLLEWALRNFTNKKLFSEGQVLASAPVVLGKKETLPLTIEKDVFLTLPLEKAGDIKAEVQYSSPVIAPVTQGDRVGTLVISIPSQANLEVPLLAKESVAQPGFFMRTLAKMGLFFRQNS